MTDAERIAKLEQDLANAREVLAAYDVLVDDLRAKIADSDAQIEWLEESGR